MSGPRRLPVRRAKITRRSTRARHLTPESIQDSPSFPNLAHDLIHRTSCVRFFRATTNQSFEETS